jgi:hypothetical protein
MGLWDVEAPTFYRQSANKWLWGCQPYAPVVLYSQEDSWLSRPQNHSAAGRIRSIEKSRLIFSLHHFILNGVARPLWLIRYGLDYLRIGVSFPVVQNCLSLSPFQTDYGTHLLPYPVDTGCSFPGHWVDYWSPSSAKVKNAWSCTSTSPYVFIAWCLIKHGGSSSLLYTQPCCVLGALIAQSV